MDSITVQTILLSILTSIITGGFILVFVEIGNRKNRENDRYEQIMGPFVHKLSSYFRFLSWCSSCIKYPKKLNEYEIIFKKIVEGIEIYGGRAIVSGGDYSIDHFSANELCDICSQINNIWYYHDKMKPCNLRWEDSINIEDYIAKELKEFFPHYLSDTKDVIFFSKISGDFYTDIYQPIENETYKHKAYIEHFKRQTGFVAIAVGFVLFVLVSMLFVQLPVWIMQAAGVFVVVLLVLCLLLLGIETNIQIKYYNQLRDFLTKMQKKNSGKKKDNRNSSAILRKCVHFILESVVFVGLLLAIWSVLCIEIGVIPKIPVPWDESLILGLNRLLLNLSYSYIAGVIVYWLVVKLPSLKNRI